MDESIKLKRQIEILGLLIMNRKNVYKNFELADFFSVSKPTLDRDLRELRERGVDIHSTAKGGIVIQNNVKPELLKELLLQYLVFNYADYMFGIIESFFPYTDLKLVLEVLVKLQKAIDKRNQVAIILKDESKKLLRGLHYEPRLIFKNDKEWCLLLSDKSEFIIIPIGAIADVVVSDSVFGFIHKNMLLEEIRKITGKNVCDRKYKIKLAFTRLDESNIPDNLTKVRFYSEEADGIVRLEAEVNSLDEIAGWVFSQSKNLTFIEPPELSEKIFELMKGFTKIFKAKKEKMLKEILAFVPESPSGKRKSARLKESDLNYSVKRMPDVYESREFFYQEPKYTELDFSFDLNICTN